MLTLALSIGHHTSLRLMELAGAATGEDDRDRVAVHDRPDRARSAWVSGERSKVAVRRRRPVLDARELREHALVVRGQAPDVPVDLEAAPLPREVFVELPAHAIDRLRRPEHARAELLRERLEL